MKIFAKRLKELRLEKHLSQAELAKELNVSQRSISSWETGFREPDFQMLVSLSKYFNVTTDYLLGVSDY